jgi:hypothetical protein
MKKLKFLALGLGLLILFGAGISKALAFEGLVDYHINASGHSMDMEYLLKGHKLRFNGNATMHNGAGILDSDKKTVTILMPEQKMYMVQNVTDYKKLASQANGTFTDTGNSETILGYKCEEYLYKSKSGLAHIWLASKLGYFGGMLHGQSGGMDAWVKMAQDKGLFPLKSVYTDNNGKEKYTMTATKIESQTVDDSNFQVPSDYKEIQMPKMDMGQMAPNAGNAQMPKVKIPGF